MRIYDSRLGRFLSVDPLTKSYPWYTPYQFAGNTPIWAIDLDGLEEFSIHELTLKNSYGESFIYLTTWQAIKPSDRIDPTSGAVFVFPSTQFSSGTPPINLTFSKSFFRQNAAFIENKSTDTRLTVMRAQNSLGSEGGRILTLNSPTLHFDPDEGKTVKEVEKGFNLSETQLKALDNIASALVADPNLQVTVLGSASYKATNIDGQENNTTVQNNQILAQKRADAGKQYLLNYISKTLGVDGFDPNRIETQTNVSKNNTTDTNEMKQEQSVKFIPKLN
jgi:hypothetical protein